MILKYLLQKEFTQLLHNAFIPKLVVLFPIALICVMPWVMSMEVKNIKVEIVDHDRSTTSQRLTHRIEASNYFIFNGQANTYQEALSHIEEGKTDVILEIPYNYERQLVNGRMPQILIAANAANATKGSMGSSYLSQIVTANLNGNASTSQLHIAVVNLFNNHLNYKILMIPALMGILLMMLCGYLPAFNIVGEKESGTIEQINVTPVKKWQFILAKLIPYWVIGLIVMTVSIILAWLVYGITCQGCLAWVYLLAILLALIFSGLGLCISNYSDNMQQAVFMMWFVVVVLMLMSGMFTPVTSMPEWAQTIVTANPLHYFIDAIRTVFVRGGGLGSIAHQVCALAGFALVLDGWAIFSYRKNN